MAIESIQYFDAVNDGRNMCVQLNAHRTTTAKNFESASDCKENIYIRFGAQISNSFEIISNFETSRHRRFEI